MLSQRTPLNIYQDTRWYFVFCVLVFLLPIFSELTSGSVKNLIKVAWLFCVVFALIVQQWKSSFTKANLLNYDLIIYSFICFAFAVNASRPIIFGVHDNLNSYIFYTLFYLILPFFSLFLQKNIESNFESIKQFIAFTRRIIVPVFSILAMLAMFDVFFPTSLLFVCALQGLVIYDFINSEKLKTGSTFAMVVTVLLIVTYESRSSLMLFYFCLLLGSLTSRSYINTVKKVLFSLVTVVVAALVVRGLEFHFFFSELMRFFIGISYIYSMETVALTGKTMDLDRWLHIVVAFNAINSDPIELIFGNGLNSASYDLGYALKREYEYFFQHLDFDKELGNIQNVSTFGVSKLLYENGLLMVLFFFAYIISLMLSWYKAWGAVVTIFIFTLLVAFLAKLYSNDYTKEILFFAFICPGGLLHIIGRCVNLTHKRNQIS